MQRPHTASVVPSGREAPHIGQDRGRIKSGMYDKNFKKVCMTESGLDWVREELV